MIVGYVLTEPARAEEARDALLQELTGLIAEPATSEEFQRARTKLQGHLLISAQAQSARVRRAMRDRLYGRSANDLPDLVARIQACQSDEIATAARRWFDPARYFEVILGPDGDTG